VRLRRHLARRDPLPEGPLGDEVLPEFAVYGTPEAVADRLLELREKLGYSTLSVWMNSGGQVPHERVITSMRLFADRVMPRLG